MDTLEATECSNRRARNVRELEIELNDFIASDCSSISDGNSCIQRIAGIDSRLGKTKIAVAKRGVAEPVSKRLEWFAFEVAVSATLHRVVLKVGQLMNIFIESDGKTSCRIVLAA